MRLAASVGRSGDTRLLRSTKIPSSLDNWLILILTFSTSKYAANQTERRHNKDFFLCLKCANMRGLWLVTRFMAWCHLEMSSDQHSTVATPSASSLMGDKIITPGTHVTHRKNIQPMNNSWYFYAFWLFFQQFSDCLRGCGVSIVYGKDPCYASSAVCDYKDTISEKRTKTPIKSSDFLLHPFSFLVLPLLGFVPQQWPSKSWDYISLSISFKHSQKNSGFPWKTQFSLLQCLAGDGSGCSIRHRQALVTLSSRWKKLRILTFPNPVKLTPIRAFLNSLLTFYQVH